MNNFESTRGAAATTSRRAPRIVLLAAALTAISMLAGTGIAAVGGGQIVYEGYDELSGDSDLYTMNADGSDVTPLTSDGAAKGHPEWSPDGTRITFESIGYESGSCCSRNIYVIDADGGNRQALTETPDVSIGENFDASWAPDGERLVFVSNRGEPGGFAGDRELYLMNADGSDETQLTDTDARTSDQQPAISPDGTQVAFASDRANSGSDDLFDIYTMGIDGSNPTRLTFDGAYNSRLSSRSKAPAWSPDGSRIAFESTRSGNPEIWVMDADGSDPVNVSNDLGVDTEPAWSPDGSEITFTSSRSGQEDVWAVDAPAASARISLGAAVGPATATAATAPRNLTPGDGPASRSPDWGTAPVVDPRACTVEGTPRPDVITGTPQSDVICGYGGNDRILGGAGDDIINGGRGGDRLDGEVGSDTVIGGPEADLLLGRGGDDRLRSRDGVDRNDYVHGGPGTDRMTTDPEERSVIAIP